MGRGTGRGGGVTGLGGRTGVGGGGGTLDTGGVLCGDYESVGLGKVCPEDRAPHAVGPQGLALCRTHVPHPAHRGNILLS